MDTKKPKRKINKANYFIFTKRDRSDKIKESEIQSLAKYTEIETDQFEKLETITEQKKQKITRYEKMLQAFDYFTVIPNSLNKIQVKSEVFKRIISLTGRHRVELLNYIIFKIVKTIETRRKKSKHSPKKKHKRKVLNKDPAYEKLLNFLQVFLIRTYSETISIPTYSMKRIYDMLNMELYFVLSICTITCIKYIDEEEEENMNRINLMNFRSMFMQNLSKYEELEKLNKFHFRNDFTKKVSLFAKFEDFFSPLFKVDMDYVNKLNQKKVNLKKPMSNIDFVEKYRSIFDFLKFYVVRMKSGQCHIIAKESFEMIIKKMKSQWCDLLNYLKIETNSSEEKIQIMKKTNIINRLNEKGKDNEIQENPKLKFEYEISNKLIKSDLSSLIEVFRSVEEKINGKPENVENSNQENFSTLETFRLYDKTEFNSEPVRETNIQFNDEVPTLTLKNSEEELKKSSDQLELIERTEEKIEADFIEDLRSISKTIKENSEKLEKIDEVKEEENIIFEEKFADGDGDIPQVLNYINCESNLQNQGNNESLGFINRNGVETDEVITNGVDQKFTMLVPNENKYIVQNEETDCKNVINDDPKDHLSEDYNKFVNQVKNLEIKFHQDENLGDISIEKNNNNEEPKVSEELKKVENLDNNKEEEEKILDENIVNFSIEKVINYEEPNLIQEINQIENIGIKYEEDDKISDENVENNSIEKEINKEEPIIIEESNQIGNHDINKEKEEKILDENFINNSIEKGTTNEEAEVTEQVHQIKYLNSNKYEEKTPAFLEKIEEKSIISEFSEEQTELKEKSENMIIYTIADNEEISNIQNLEINENHGDQLENTENKMILFTIRESVAIREEELEKPTKILIVPESNPIANDLVERNNDKRKEKNNVDQFNLVEEENFKFGVLNLVEENKDNIIYNQSDQLQPEVEFIEYIEEQPEKPEDNLNKSEIDMDGEKCDLITSDENINPGEEISKPVYEKINEESVTIIKEKIEQEEMEILETNYKNQSEAENLNAINEKVKEIQHQLNEINVEEIDKLLNDPIVQVEKEKLVADNEENKEDESDMIIIEENNLILTDEIELTESKEIAEEGVKIIEENVIEEEINVSEEGKNIIDEEVEPREDVNKCQANAEIEYIENLLKNENIDMIVEEDSNKEVSQPESQPIEEACNADNNEEVIKEIINKEENHTENNNLITPIKNESNELKELRQFDDISSIDLERTIPVSIKENRIFIVKHHKVENDSVVDLEDISYFDQKNNLFQEGEIITSYNGTIQNNTQVPIIKKQSTIRNEIEIKPVIKTNYGYMIRKYNLFKKFIEEEEISSLKDILKPKIKIPLIIQKKIYQCLRYPIELFILKIKDKNNTLSKSNSLLITSKDFEEKECKNIEDESSCYNEDKNKAELNFRISEDLLIPYYGISNIRDLADPEYIPSPLSDNLSDIKDVKKTFNNIVNTKYLLPEKAETLLKISYSLNSFLFIGHIHNIIRHLIFRKKVEQKVKQKLSYKEFLFMKDKFTLP